MKKEMKTFLIIWKWSVKNIAPANASRTTTRYRTIRRVLSEKGEAAQQIRNPVRPIISSSILEKSNPNTLFLEKKEPREIETSLFSPSCVVQKISTTFWKLSEERLKLESNILSRAAINKYAIATYERWPGRVSNSETKMNPRSQERISRKNEESVKIKNRARFFSELFELSSP